MSGFDAEILQDFLTESGELLERLEGELVVLERTPDDPDLINQAFRALHTIKGSASFLALTSLVSVAHAAEGALNAARNGQARVDRPFMDLLLQAVDLLKTHMGQVRAGAPLSEPHPALIRGLTDIAEGRGSVRAATPEDRAASAEPGAPARGTGPAGDAWPRRTPLSLPPSKADLVEFLIADLDESLSRVESKLAQVRSGGASSAELGETCEGLVLAVDFFECAPMVRVARALSKSASRLCDLEASARAQVLPRAAALVEILKRQASGLRRSELLEWPADTLIGRIETVLSGGTPAAEHLLAPDADAASVIDAECAGEAPAAPACATGTPATPAEPEPGELAGVAPAEAGGGGAPAPGPGGPGTPAGQGAGPGQGAGASEQTIRVDVGRLESLMNLVGELVLQKNRLSALARRAGVTTAADAQAELAEALQLAAGSLDRVTADIQLAVMRTRMQPLEKLFGRYPRLIRDLARKTGKQIDLVIEGGSTEVDKSVIDELADPLVHLLRNSADHGLEPAEERVAAGKGPTGTIRLSASQAADHVRIQVIDDGRGLSRERIARKAVERGLVPEASVAALSDREVYQFIFLPGFSTADQVSDLSGRGVGMDVVRTNIQKIKGSIELDSRPGQGTTITITIPLTVAIMPAMLVGVAREIYAIPLNTIVEIVKPRREEISTVGGRPVMRLRDAVLPLADGAALFGLEGSDPSGSPFAVVLSMNQARVGLLVSRLIGQQEVVIKPLDAMDRGDGSRKGPISGATVRDDGGVSLIVDVQRLMRIAQESSPTGAAA